MYDKIFSYMRERETETQSLAEVVIVGNKSQQDLIAILRASGVDVSQLAESMILKTTLPVEDAIITFSQPVTPRDLGFVRPPTTVQLFNKAREIGLELIPKAFGTHLRLWYVSQKPGSVEHVAMESVKDSRGLDGIYELSSTINPDDGIKNLTLKFAPSPFGKRWQLNDRFRFQVKHANLGK